MLTYILLMYLSTQIPLIYANPLYQTYAPPCPCQHNSWFQPDLLFEPTNINPYAVLPQPPTTTCQASPYNQEYVNKVLSNPSLRTILDPNTKLFDQNGFEIPRTKPESCPNVINNYIIIPPEVLVEQQNLKQDGGRKRNKHGRKTKSIHKHTSENNFINNNQQHRKLVTHVPNSYGKTYDVHLRNSLITNENHNSNFNERKPKVILKNKSLNAELDKASNNSDVSVKEKENVIRLKIITLPNNPKEEAVVQEFRRKFPGIPEELVRSLLVYLKTKLASGELGKDNKYSDIPANIKNNLKSSSRSRKSRRKNRKQRKGERNDKKCISTVETLAHPVDDIEKNITTTNDTIQLTQTDKISDDSPEILTENKGTFETTTMKSILENNFKPNNFNCTPQNTDEDLKEDMEEQELIINKSDQVPLKRKEIKKEQKINKEEIDEVIDQIYKPDTDDHKVDYNYNIDNTRLPELGTEDEVPITVNGIFEDYYPDFRVANQFSVSDEEFSSSDFHASRYHYATERSSKLEELSRERRKYEQNYDKNHHTKFFLDEKSTHGIENYDEKLSDKFEGTAPVSITIKEESEEISFKVPPALEIPDFETKNVREFKSYYEEASKYEPFLKYSDVSDKTSVYSNTKNQKYDKAKPDWKKKKHGDLETVYARSKVVKYGHNSDNTANISDDANEKYPHIVIAESYPDYVW